MTNIVNILAAIAPSVMILGGLLLFILWLSYLFEAFQESKGQGFMLLLIPGYLFYYGFIRSRHSRPFQISLIAAPILIMYGNLVFFLQLSLNITP